MRLQAIGSCGRATTRARARARMGTVAVAAGLVTALVLLGASPAPAASFTAGQNADLVLGSLNFTATAFDDGARMTYGMSDPNGVAVDGSGSVYVADSGSNRLMRWATTPASDGAAMTNVLAKANASQTSWTFSCTGGVEGPEQLSAAGDGATGKLAVADRYGSRVILYNSEQTTDGPTGSIFLGQSGGGGCSSNRGGGVGQNTLSYPTGVWTDGTKLAVADSANHRVLLWNSWPTANGQNADVVLGQADFVSRLANRGGASPGQNTLDNPKGVYFDGSYLYVADSTNNRVLVWTGWPATNGANANFRLGQGSYTSTGTSCSATGFSYPTSISAFGSGAAHKLAVVAQTQRRVLVFTGFQAAPANQPAATDVLGQASLTACSRNRGTGAAASNSLNSPNAVTIDGSGNAWVADTGNNRVLRFPALTTGTAADREFGHAGATAFTASVPMDGIDDLVIPATNGATASYSIGASVTMAPDGSLLSTSATQGALHIWNGAPAANNEAFDLRWGQTSRSNAGLNGPSDIAGSSTLSNAHGSWTDGTRLLVADTDNDRVLVWTSFPTSDTDPADYVLGQSTFTGTSSSQGPSRMDSPFGVTSDGTDVYVADTSNDRVIIFRNFWAAPANGKAADVVLGQIDWTNSSGAASLTRVNNPSGIDIDNDRLVVADHDNSRIVIWNNASTLSSFAPIDAVIGQSNATNAGSGGIAEDTPDVAAEANALMWVEDCRAFVLDPIPTSGFITAGASLIGNGCTSPPAQNAVDSPSGIDAKNGRVWIANGQHARLMRWTDTSAPTISVAPTATVRCDGTVTVTWTTSESTTTEVYYGTTTQALYTGYPSSSIDPAFTGLTHSANLSFATPGTRFARVRAVDWNGQSVVSGEISFTVPATCPAPTTMLGDDANAQSGTGRANPSASNAPPIQTSAFHTSWLQSSGVTMDRVQSQTWSTPPEHAGGLWRFDANPNADTSSQNTSAMAWTGTATYASGKFGQAADVSGATRYGTIPDSTSVRAANGFTVDLWFNTTSIANSTYPIMAAKTGAGQDCATSTRCNYSLEWDRTQNELCAELVTTANVVVWACRSAVGLLDGQWHHAAMTVSATNQLTLFVDGAVAAGPVAMGAPARTQAGDPIYVGRGGTASNPFIGQVDELRFSPVAYDAAAIAGYYRTNRKHAEQLWDSTSTALGSNCATAARCEDQIYAGVAPILRTGARYWQRARFNTLNNDYWSDYGVDWLETSPVTSITVTTGASAALGTVLPGIDYFGSSSVDVTTNSATGYQLFARDENDTWGLERLGGGPTVPDRQDGATAPAVWPANTSGFFGVTVRDATGGRLAKWGVGTGTAQSDVTNNYYTGLESTSDVLLHQRLSYGLGTDTVLLTWRSNVAAAQASGDYDGVVTLTATAAP